SSTWVAVLRCGEGSASPIDRCLPPSSPVATSRVSTTSCQPTIAPATPMLVASPGTNIASPASASVPNTQPIQAAPRVNIVAIPQAIEPTSITAAKPTPIAVVCCDAPSKPNG